MFKDEWYYLAGVYFGDGHIYYADCSYQFTVVSEDLDLCTNCSRITNKLFNSPGTISFSGGCNKLVVCSKSLCDALLDCMSSGKYCNYKKLSKIEKKNKLPEFSSTEERDSFITGLMDSDGWISKRKNGIYTKYEIGFKNTNILTPTLYEVFSDIGIKCNKLNFCQEKTLLRNGKLSHEKAQWNWTMNIPSFLTKAHFGISRKINLCLEYTDYINRNKNGKEQNYINTSF